MRVLYITPNVPNLLRTRPYYLLKNLAMRHRITVLAPGFSSGDERDAGQLAQDIPGLEVITVPVTKAEAIRNSLMALPQGQSMQARYCYSPALVKKLYLLAGSGNYDLAHVEHYRMGYTGHIIAGTGLPVFYDAVDSISLLVSRTLKYGPLKNRLVSLLELGATRRYEGSLLSSGTFEGICATSREDAEELERLAGLNNKAIRVISNGVDTAYFNPGQEKKEPDSVVFSGKMSYHANAAAARYLVKEIWPHILKQRPNAKLWIVGSRPPRDLLKLSGKNGIEVTGFVLDVRDYLRKATVAVAPMVYSVGIQNKVLEAMACGTPVVATSGVSRSITAASDKEIVLVVPDRPEEFARQVTHLLENPRRAGQIGQAGRERVIQDYTWESAAHQLEMLWSGLKINTTFTAVRSV